MQLYFNYCDKNKFAPIELSKSDLKVFNIRNLSRKISLIFGIVTLLFSMFFLFINVFGGLFFALFACMGITGGTILSAEKYETFLKQLENGVFDNEKNGSVTTYSLSDELKILEQLYNAGTITQEEFTIGKKVILEKNKIT